MGEGGGDCHVRSCVPRFSFSFFFTKTPITKCMHDSGSDPPLSNLRKMDLLANSFEVCETNSREADTQTLVDGGGIAAPAQ